MEKGDLSCKRSGVATRAWLRSRLYIAPIFTVAAVGLLGSQLKAQVVPDPVATIPSLVGVKPVLPDVSAYIQDADAAQQLGKALFWDTAVGSDGQACATCHFHAGGDIRTKNQVDPGIRGNDFIFNARPGSAGISGPNKQLVSTDFPFHQLLNVNDRESGVKFDTNDIFSSQGTYAGDFVSAKALAFRNGVTTQVGDKSVLRRSERCTLTYNPYDPVTNPGGNPFHTNNLIYRKVEPRQTPTTINAVFNVRQFWDGRANYEFNGVDPFGPRTYASAFPNPDNSGFLIGNPHAAGTGILVQTGPKPLNVLLTKPLIPNGSLASQAVGPPLSDFEMSCGGKTFADLGRKILAMRPLSTQVADANDSLFSKSPGLVPNIPLTGLNTTYKALVEKAFYPKYWSATSLYKIDPATGAITTGAGGFRQEELNFSLFWGLAIQAYEQLLISDDSPFDRGPAAMGPAAVAGMAVFTGKGKCIACHNGPLLSGATQSSGSSEPNKPIEGMLMGDGKTAIYDQGFYNIGVRPTVEDVGVGGFDPYGFDLSFTRQYKWSLIGQQNRSPDHFNPTPCTFAVAIFIDCNNPAVASAADLPRDSVDGSFKVPILRNIGLNPPYFHNGGQATLKDVVRFYNRGGDRRGQLGNDTTGTPTPTPFGNVNTSNLDPDIGDASNTSVNNALGLTATEQSNLVQFLLSLTDQRVACHSGVFDHPSLPLAIGQSDIARTNSQQARDLVYTLPAVGQQGYATCFPNTGDLFNTLNTTDARGLQATFKQILKR